MFNAIFARPYRHNAPLTKGRVYEVIDFNDYFGTYYVIDDNGERKAIEWDRFMDNGKAAAEYQKRYIA